MIKQCKFCGKTFNSDRYHKSFCSVECAEADKDKLKHYIPHDSRFFEKEDVDEKEKRNARLDKYISEAVECRMSYGKYRMFRDVFGKTFDELKNGD